MRQAPLQAEAKTPAEDPAATAGSCCNTRPNMSAVAAEGQSHPDASIFAKAPAEPMHDPHEKRLERQWNRLRAELPEVASHSLGWLRERKARLVRIPVGILLIAGGFLGFLPILGFWMVPLGLLLLAQDIPFLKGPTGRVLVWFNRSWQLWKRWWRGENPLPPSRRRDAERANDDKS